MNISIKNEETRSFRPNQNIIYHLIKSQNSTPISAIKELIQNSHDAKASIIELDFFTDEDEFTIKDNGNGFKDKSEIESFFEEFGKAHEDDEYLDNEKFGRFRMGRCQIMAYASTIWRSGHFSMKVDIKKNGLDYILTEHEEFYKGCLITGEWYSSEWELEEGRYSQYSQDYYINKLKKESKYLTKCELYIDYELVNPTINENEISYEDENFIFIKDKINSNQNFLNSSVFNLGIFTTNVSLYQSGTIITKKHLQLDISRKNIDNNCNIYNQIIKVLENLYGNKKIRIKKKINNKERIEYFLNFFNDLYSTKELHWRNISQILLFRNYNNTKFYSLKDLFSNRFVLVSESMENEFDDLSYKLDKIEQTNLYLIIDCNELEVAIEKHNAKNEDSNRINENINKNDIFYKLLKHLHISKNTIDSYKCNNIEIKEAFKSISIDNNYQIIDENNLNKEQLISFKAIEAAHRYTSQYLFLNYSRDSKLISSIINRSIKPGNSNGKACAWTDGHSYIYIDLKMLELYKKNIEKIAFILIHEYCHDNTNNTHDGEFYSKFHNLTCDHPDIFNKLKNNLTNMYRAKLKYYKLRLPSHIETKISSKAANSKINKLITKNSRYEEDLKKIMSHLIKNKIDFNIEIPNYLIDKYNNSIKSNIKYSDHINLQKDDNHNYFKVIRNNAFEKLYLDILKINEFVRFLNELNDKKQLKINNIINDIVENENSRIITIVIRDSIKYYKLEIIDNIIYIFWQFYDLDTVNINKEYCTNFIINKLDELNDWFNRYLERKKSFKAQDSFKNFKNINISADLDFFTEVEKLKLNLKTEAIFS